jgi:hypothetical protein
MEYKYMKILINKFLENTCLVKYISTYKYLDIKLEAYNKSMIEKPINEKERFKRI